MKLILITNPTPIKGEYDSIFALFDLGLELLHIRKPEFKEDDIRRFLDHIPASYYFKMVLHHHVHIAEEYGLKGVHHTMRTSYIPEFKGSQSKSFHGIEELKQNEFDYDYGFISPVYNSISKPGYKSGFSQNELELLPTLTNIPLFALGGIEPSKVRSLKGLGFEGVVVLGAIWREIEFAELMKKFKIFQLLCKQ